MNNCMSEQVASVLLFVGVIVPLLIAGVWLLLKAFDCGFVMQ